MVSSIGNSGISQIQNQQYLQEVQQQQQVKATKVQVFSDQDSLSVGQGPSANFKSALSPEMQGNINELLSGLSADDKNAVISAGKDLANALSGISGAASSEEISGMISGSMANIEKTLGTGDVDMLACDSMLAAYAGCNDDLMVLANKCSNTTEIKKEIREDISMLQDELSDWPEGQDKMEITYNEYSQNADGTFSSKEVTKEMTKEDVNNLIDSLNSTKDTLSEMNQMDMLNLQNAMNNQSQLMQTVSNIMKVMHDTAKSIIQNLR